MSRFAQFTIALCIFCAVYVQRGAALALHSQAAVRRLPLSRLQASSSSSSSSSTAALHPLEQHLLKSASSSTSPLSKAGEYDEISELKYMIKADISRASNFYDRSLQRLHNLRRGADKKNRENVETQFAEFMESGFNRRLVSEQQPQSVSLASPAAGASLTRFAASQTSFHLELGKSQEQRLQEVQKKRMEKRSGVVKLFPQQYHKYFDYLDSLRIKPTKEDQVRTVGISAFLAFIVSMNSNFRMAFAYSVAGNLVTLSLLLTRNMPSGKLTRDTAAMREAKRRMATWSSQSFNTGVGVLLFHLLPTLALTLLSTLLVPLTWSIRLRSSLIVSMLATAYWSTAYEVFEAKGKGGWRWRRAMDADNVNLSVDEREQLASDEFGVAPVRGDQYDYAYDPQVDDYPPRPKYLDELLPKVTGSVGGSGDLDDQASRKHFDEWRLALKESRKPPLMDLASDDPLLGGKPGMFIGEGGGKEGSTEVVPDWLEQAYHEGRKIVPWQRIPRQWKKDPTNEFKMIDGPLGFRDKLPEWLNTMFGSGVWEEKTTVSRRAARAFGTYRKAMWKLDKKVELMPSDGADKDPPKVPSA